MDSAAARAMAARQGTGRVLTMASTVTRGMTAFFNANDTSDGQKGQYRQWTSGIGECKDWQDGWDITRHSGIVRHRRDFTRAELVLDQVSKYLVRYLRHAPNIRKACNLKAAWCHIG